MGLNAWLTAQLLTPVCFSIDARPAVMLCCTFLAGGINVEERGQRGQAHAVCPGEKHQLLVLSTNHQAGGESEFDYVAKSMWIPA